MLTVRDGRDAPRTVIPRDQWDFLAPSEGPEVGRLTRIRLDGGFQGGMIDQEPVVPVTFNTGQILMGLSAGVRQLGDEYRCPMRSAANWLVTTQDPDGCWRKHQTPFARPWLKAMMLW